MTVLVLSDVHSNLEALEACLAVAPAYDTVFNLGDVVGYGASPNEVCTACRRLGGLLIRGNHDKACSRVSEGTDFNPIAYAAVLWTRRTLSDDNLAWVKSLPQGPVRPPDLPGVQCAHGSPLDEDAYLITTREAYSSITQAAVPLTFFGHSHIQGGFAMQNDVWETLCPLYETKDALDQFELPLRPGATYLINPGSVGQPRDGDPRAAFATFDTQRYSITFHRVPYNLPAAQQRIFDAGLPERLGLRLAQGR